MGLLLYKSNEMYSSTELIRKSKTIFNKILDGEIEKAIILRDGKPSFLLMDFEKYEKIMAEYEELKESVASNKEKPAKKTKEPKKKNTKSKNQLKEELIKQSQRISIDGTDYAERTKEVETPVEEVEKISAIDRLPSNDEPLEVINETENEEVIEKVEETQQNDVVEELSEEEEISNALKSIESMNFDGDMKKMAEDKIKAKILQARKERAALLAVEEQRVQEEEKEEQELAQQIEEDKEKKERELKEFWD